MSTGTNEQMITGGELVAKALKAEGIEVIYTLCGGHIIDIYNGCLNEGIKIIDVRHEEVASQRLWDAHSCQKRVFGNSTL